MSQPTDPTLQPLKDQLDNLDTLAEACAQPFLHGDRTGMDGLHPMILRHVHTWTPAAVQTLTASIRGIIDEYETAQVYYTTNQWAPAGELTGLRTALDRLAEGLGISQGVTS